MDIIDHIFEALGGPTAIASSTGDPVQTVHSWKANKSIPPWRRSSVLKVKPPEGKELSAKAVEYLQSDERKPRKPAAEARAA